jgi:hypothetical protein
MQISLEKFALFMTGVVSVGLFLGVGYFFYVVFFTGPKPDDVPALSVASVASFSPKLQKAAAAIIEPTAKVNLDKNSLMFMETPIYKSFTDEPAIVATSTVRGRDNPFIPTYVTP